MPLISQIMPPNIMVVVFAVPQNPARLRIYYCGNLVVRARRCNGRKPDSAINAAWWLSLRNIYAFCQHGYHRSSANGARLGLRWIPERFKG
jgi:hypothetical protein